ncbi:MAG: hypothetical protein NT152_05125 [Actinobacteria bacterium]|nr:hypothetical protein [Actinomycetota bacterium]
MSIFDFNGGGKPNSVRLKPTKLVLGSIILAAVLGLGSTLAANININSGPVEFGQGVAQTTACDGAITITPSSAFDNTATPSPEPTPSTATGVFNLKSISVSDIDVTSGDCSGKTFTIKVYGESSNTPLELANGLSSFIVHATGSGFIKAQSGYTLESVDETSFIITIDSPLVSSSQVYKVTIESSDIAVSTEPSYYPFGPQADVSGTTVTSGGWELCWSGPYNGFASFSSIQASCTGEYLMYAGWAGASTSPETIPATITLLAAAPRTDVFTVTNSSSASDAHIANGSGWYFSDDRGGTSNKAVGFGSADSMWSGSPCGESPLGICWHSAPDLPASYGWAGSPYPVWANSEPGLSPGWSLAGTQFLGQGPSMGYGADYTRAIFQSTGN